MTVLAWLKVTVTTNRLIAGLALLGALVLGWIIGQSAPGSGR